MTVTSDEIRRILELIENSAFDELHLEVGDFRLAVSKSGALAPAAAAPSTAAQAAPPPAPAAAPAPAVPSRPSVAPSASAAAPEGLVEITAPIVGIFYIAPEPGADPFVDAGTTITPDTTVGIIEVMKVFNTVPAKQAGRVVRRLVENGDFVEFGQPLFLIDPEGA